VDFNLAVPIQSLNQGIPVWLAKYLGLLKIAAYQVLPALLESRRS
jgi:hypothetical protein